MTTLVFVHGTGVRRTSFDATLTVVRDGVRRHVPDLDVVPCFWGEPLGAVLSRNGASIPQTSTVRGVDELDDTWILLELDPLYELRLLAASERPAGDREQPVDRVPPGRRLRDAVLVLPGDPAVVEALHGTAMAGTFADAAAEVLGSVETAAALASAAPSDVVGRAVAYAVVARAITLADERSQGTVPVTGDQRDAVVEAMTAALGVDVRGRGGNVLDSGLRLADALGLVGWVDRRRTLLTAAASPAAGDVMVYLARGAAIRSHVAATVRAVADDVVLLAHSLGGVACVDLLVDDVPDNVRGLITVGSQAGYLHELGALPSLEPAELLPDTFPVPWINVFDTRDYLAFLAEPVFGERVRDVRVDNRMPFPRSHSAYFVNPQLYAVIGGVRAAVGR